MAEALRGILHGIRLLDLTRTHPGQYCAMMLADHGAEVIRIESTSDGMHDPHLSRNKKSVALNLDSGEGKAGLRTLAATGSVLIEDFEFDVMHDAGLSYESLAEVNPALVYARMDPGNSSSNAKAAGSSMAFGILAALRESETTGRGQVVDLAKLDEDGISTNDFHNPIRFSNAPMPPPRSAPKIGEHTEAYLSEMPPSLLSDTEKRAVRNAFGCFATGVTIVTTRQEDGVPRGFTANSFTSVSLDPPLLLVCIAKQAHSCPVFTNSDHFAVNILSEDQKALSNLFASQSEEKFEKSQWHPSVADMPIFNEGLASFVCGREKVVDAGDHVILLGRIVDQSSKPGQPLGYLRGNYFSVGLEQELVDAAKAASCSR